MSLELFNAVPAGAIEVLLDAENQPWFKRAHVGKFLGLKHIETSLEGLSKCEERTRSMFEMTPVVRGSYPAVQDTDKFLSVYGVMYAIVKSRKSKAKALKEWVMKDVVPRGLNQVIAEKQDMIEEKDTQLALLNDDLTESEKQIVILEQDNLELQANIERLTPRAVPYLENEKKDNGMVIIQKNNSDPYSYMAICGKQCGKEDSEQTGRSS